MNLTSRRLFGACLRGWAGFIGLALVLSSSLATARVFDMGGEKFASYLRLEYQPSTIKRAAFENASNHGEVYDAELAKLYAGEFGMLFATQFVNLRFGIEVIRPPTTKVNATDAGGAPLYTLDSDISVVIPKVGVEVSLKKWKESRLYLNANYGQANLGMVNSYTMTAAGKSTTGKSDYTEDGRGIAAQFDGALGFETLLFDSTSLALEAGYRQLKFDSLKHNRDADTIPQGSVTKGAALLNADGSPRALDFTGYFVSLNFRFWIF